LIPAVAAVLLTRVLEPASLFATLPSLLLRSSRAEDVLYHLSRLNALDGFLFGGFVGVGDRRSENVFDHAPWKAFDEELDGFQIG